MSINNVLNLQISLQEAPVQAAGFGTLMLLSTDATVLGWVDVFRTYASTTEAAADGINTSSALYKAIGKAFAQKVKPARVAVGKVNVRPLKVRITWVSADDGDHTVTINGVDHTFAASGNTIEETRDGVLALMGALAGGLSTAAHSNNAIDVTGYGDGSAFTYAVETPDSDASAAVTQTAITIADVFEAIEDEAPGEWYGAAFVADMGGSAVSIEIAREAADWVEGRRRKLGVWTAETDTRDAEAGSLGKVLFDGGYERTTCVWHENAADDFLLIAVMADRLAVDPDSRSTIWRFLTPRGVVASTLTTAQQDSLESINVNYAVRYGGRTQFNPGVMASGQKPDLILAVDWLHARLTERYQALFAKYTNESSKIPYTDAGIAIFEEATRSQIQRGVAIGHFTDDPPYSVTMPTRATAAPADVTNRIIRFEFRVDPAGAIEGATITGNVAITTQA